MKEKVERFCDSFKNGVFLWLVSYFLLYAVGVHIGDNSLYNAEIMKLLDVKNFLTQVIIVGVTYIALDLAFSKYFNNIVEVVSLNVSSKKKVLKDVIAIIVILLIILPTIEYIKDNNIVNKAIMKLMIGLIIFKTMIFCMVQTVKTDIYNKKLQEKNKE